MMTDDEFWKNFRLTWLVFGILGAFLWGISAVGSALPAGPVELGRLAKYCVPAGQRFSPQELSAMTRGEAQAGVTRCDRMTANAGVQALTEPSTIVVNGVTYAAVAAVAGPAPTK